MSAERTPPTRPASNSPGGRGDPTNPNPSGASSDGGTGRLHLEAGAEPVPGYRLLEPLGTGGFGEVWKAAGPGGALKAVKVLYGGLDHLEEKDRRRARQELKSLRRIQSVRHPFLLSLERYDVIDGRLIIVTELADRTLWQEFQECRRQRLAGVPRADLLRYMEEAAEALDLMNQRHRLQHLDIKPHNLLLCFQHIKVGDFGLVKYLEQTNVTRTGGFTPAYAAPELFKGTVSRYCDQYSLAVVYQEMLTGRRPFASTLLGELARQHLTAQPDLSPLTPEDRPAIARALSKDPSARFPTCADLVRNLRLPGEELVAVRSVQEVVTGDGLLGPTLVVGLGGQGLRTLHELRTMLRDRFGTPQALPNLRLLLLDTEGNPEELRRQLGSQRILLTPLHRPAHYFASGPERVPFESWLETNQLPRPGREQRPAGRRPLGRLAFADHYPTISRRLRAELLACSATGALERGAQQSGLGIRSNQPRVYVVTHLSGGTGSGMFLDLAYAARRLLRELGYLQGEVIGLFHLPEEGDTRASANAVAALMELDFYSDPATTFSAHYRADVSLSNSAEPFDRWHTLLPGSAERGAEFLFAELTTTLTRRGPTPMTVTSASASANTVSEVPRPAWADERPAHVRCGVDRFAWPRRQVIRRSARELAADLLRRWTATVEATDVAVWLAETWAAEKFGAEALIDHLERACVQQEGLSLLESLRTWARQTPADGRGLDHLDRWLGRPGETGSALSGTGAKVEPLLRAAAATWAGEWAQRWRRQVHALFDRPGPRFARVEAAHRQGRRAVQETLDHHRALERNLIQQAAKTGPLLHLLWLRPGHGADEVLDVLLGHVEARYMGKVLERVVHVFQELLEVVGDSEREFCLCRVEVERLHSELASDTDASTGTYADEEARRFVQGLTETDHDELERDCQTTIQKQFQSLPGLCFQMTWSSRFRRLGAAVRRCAEVFVQDRVGFPAVLEKFLQSHATDKDVRQALADRMTQARAGLDDGARCFVALPADVRRLQFEGWLASEASSRPASEQSMNDIFMYAEQEVTIRGLIDRLGPAAAEAYRHALRQTQSPHCRQDVSDWGPVP